MIIVRRILFCLITLLLNDVCHAQTKTLYVGYRSPLDAQIMGELSLDNFNFIGVNLNYSFGSNRARDYGGFNTISRSFGRYGPGVGLFYKRKISPNSYYKGAVEYSNWQSARFRYLEGLSSYAAYSEFTESYDNYAILHSVIITSKNNWVGYFAEIGIHYREVVRHYSVKGWYDSKGTARNISNAVERSNRIAPTIRVGLIVQIFTK